MYTSDRTLRTQTAQPYSGKHFFLQLDSCTAKGNGGTLPAIPYSLPCFLLADQLTGIVKGILIHAARTADRERACCRREEGGCNALNVPQKVASITHSEFAAKRTLDRIELLRGSGNWIANQQHSGIVLSDHRGQFLTGDIPDSIVKQIIQYGSNLIPAAGALFFIGKFRNSFVLIPWWRERSTIKSIVKVYPVFGNHKDDISVSSCESTFVMAASEVLVMSLLVA